MVQYLHFRILKISHWCWFVGFFCNTSHMQPMVLEYGIQHLPLSKITVSHFWFLYTSTMGCIWLIFPFCPIIFLIEWASALCRQPPLCGGGRAGSVNKTTGEVKTFKTYTKQTGGSSSWVQFVYLRIWEELLGFFQNRSLTGGLRILADQPSL